MAADHCPADRRADCCKPLRRQQLATAPGMRVRSAMNCSFADGASCNDRTNLKGAGMKIFCAVVVLALVSVAPATANETRRTVASVYPSICAGALRNAILSDLKDGVIAECEDIKITAKDIEDEIAKSPEHKREQVRKYPVHVLEQTLIKRLIAKEAKEWAKKNGKSDTGDAAVSAYLSFQVPEPSVTEEEAREFYEEHAAMFGEISFEQIKDAVISVVRDEKASEAQDRFKHDVGKRHAIRVSSSWMKTQGDKWSKNPVEKARLSGKPTLVVFSVIGCCDRMLPVVELVRHSYADSLNVVFVNVSEEEVLSSIYGVRGIPVEIFYDAKGREVFRSNRSMSIKDVVDKLREMGVTVGGGGGSE